MKCVICKSSDVVEKEVEEEIRVNSDITLYPIKTKVCNSCGERYYDRETMALLEDVRGKLKKKELNLQVVGKVLRVSGAI
ncbi:MAG: YgiT-type zinc finger protein [Candidatus Hydrothermarchaeaceae archaeon]